MPDTRLLMSGLPIKEFTVSKPLGLQDIKDAIDEINNQSNIERVEERARILGDFQEYIKKRIMDAMINITENHISPAVINWGVSPIEAVVTLAIPNPLWMTGMPDMRSEAERKREESIAKWKRRQVKKEC